MSLSTVVDPIFGAAVTQPDSVLPKPTLGENPASTVSAISSFLAIIVPILGFTGEGLGFDPLPLTVILAIVGIGSGIVGLIKRKRLMNGKYSDRPNRSKLKLGQGRSIFGLLFIPLGFTILVMLANGCS